MPTAGSQPASAPSGTVTDRAIAARAAQQIFGDRLDVADRYAALLTGDGIEHGLLGPREAGRLWQRHLLNCAALVSLLPETGTVIDIGSGAGLPAIPLAIVTPGLCVVAVESLRRRVVFLRRCAEELELTNLQIVHGRAEEPGIRRSLAGSDVVTARAVAPLDRLAGWALPLLKRGGRLIAVKGERAAEEMAEHAAAVGVLGYRDLQLRSCRIDDTIAATVALTLVKA
ncbi:MAG: 16S rRNA (guanine(527)-N(7))-methyltransferase RsmG [Mycobacteriales bacterium]